MELHEIKGCSPQPSNVLRDGSLGERVTASRRYSIAVKSRRWNDAHQAKVGMNRYKSWINVELNRALLRRRLRRAAFRTRGGTVAYDSTVPRAVVLRGEMRDDAQFVSINAHIGLDAHHWLP